MIQIPLTLLSAKDNSYTSKKDGKEKDYSSVVALYNGKAMNFSIKKDQVSKILEDVVSSGGSVSVIAEIELSQFQWEGKDINSFVLKSYAPVKAK